MTIRLGLDASLRIPSCAISTGDEIALARAVGRPVEDFPDTIRRALQEAAVALRDVDEIVACVGPGSYMGVRSAVATANALALAVDCPVTGVLSLDALAVTAPASAALTVAIPAGRGRWFAASYRFVGARVERNGLPELVQHPGPDARWPDGPWTDGDGHLLNARSAIVVAERQRHLATETGCTEVSPHLPPPNIASRYARATAHMRPE
jgi:tRNA threonylcarbamoyl adenosine modification protein YeaZ